MTKARIACIEIRVQGESDPWTEDEDHTKLAPIHSLLMSVLQSPNKDKLMTEFPKRDDKEYREISQLAKDTVKEQGNFDAHEILMITDTAQCRSCHNYVTVGHHLATVELFFLEQVKKLRNKVSRTSSNCFNMFTTSALAFKTGKPRGGQQLVATDAPSCTTQREHYKTAQKKQYKKHSRAIFE